MRYLYQRHRGYYARVAVPLHLRATLGRRDVVRTLGTSDLNVAKRKLHETVAAIMAEFASAEARRELPRESADYVLQAAHEARAAVAAGTVSEDDAGRGLDATVEAHLDLLAKQRGVDPATGHPLMSDSHERAIKIAHRVFAGETVAMLSAQITAHLAEIAKSVRPQTAEDKRKVLAALLAWLGDVEVSAVTRKVAGRYLTESLAKANLSRKTITTRLSHISSMWNWLLARGVAEVNPWLRMASSLPKDRRGAEAARRAWTDGELMTLLKNTPTEDPLWALGALGMFTGARIEELASLKLTDVADDTLRIREGKSAAAVRTLPVHPAIKPLVTSLVKHSRDGWLVPGLLTGGRDARRSAGASKRFGYHLRHHLKLTDTALTFHSLRHGFTTRCEAAGIPEATAKLLTGHARESLTFGHYSKGLPLDQLADAMAKVTYGKPVDALVARLGKTVRVTVVSRRRPRQAATNQPTSRTNT